MDVTCTIVWLVWRPEFGMEWKWTPVSSWCGVQNLGWSGNGRHCHVGVASRIGGGVEMDATAMFAWRPESGMEWKWTPLPSLCGVQNQEWSGKWTPLPCLRGIQNREWSGSGRHCHVGVASRIRNGVEMDATAMLVWRPESGMEWKWTPLPCLRDVQNREWSGNGRHRHVCVASRIGVESESDATAKPPGVLRQDSCNSGRLFIRSGHFSTNSGRLLISSQCILTGVQF